MYHQSWNSTPNIAILINKQISYCEYTDKPTKFKNSYYGILYNKKVVKNSYQFKKHHIITGPNAAGKTTLLKSTLFGTKRIVA